VSDTCVRNSLLSRVELCCDVDTQGVYTSLSEKYVIFDIAESRFLSSECTKIVCRLAPTGPAGELKALHQTPLATFDGPTSKRGEGRGVVGAYFLTGTYIPCMSTPLRVAIRRYLGRVESILYYQVWCVCVCVY